MTFDLQHSPLAQGLVVLLALYLALPPLVAAVADAAATLVLARARAAATLVLARAMATEIRRSAARRTTHGS